MSSLSIVAGGHCKRVRKYDIHVVEETDLQTDVGETSEQKSYEDTAAKTRIRGGSYWLSRVFLDLSLLCLSFSI